MVVLFFIVAQDRMAMSALARVPKEIFEDVFNEVHVFSLKLPWQLHNNWFEASS